MVWQQLPRACTPAAAAVTLRGRQLHIATTCCAPPPAAAAAPPAAKPPPIPPVKRITRGVHRCWTYPELLNECQKGLHWLQPC